MKGQPLRGQMVKLNDHGINSIHGLQSFEEIEAAKSMEVIWVSAKVAVTDADVWEIEVAGPLNRHMLTNLDVELV